MLYGNHDALDRRSSAAIQASDQRARPGGQCYSKVNDARSDYRQAKRNGYTGQSNGYTGGREQKPLAGRNVQGNQRCTGLCGRCKAEMA